MEGILNRLSQASSVLSSMSEWRPPLLRVLCYCKWGTPLNPRTIEVEGRGLRRGYVTFPKQYSSSRRAQSWRLELL